MNIRTFLILSSALFVLLGCTNCSKQRHSIAFYNLENLFDTINHPNVYDEEFTPLGEKNWNSEKYNSKINNMSYVISQIGTDQKLDAPSIVGLCEVENMDVLVDLINSKHLKKYNYDIIHQDSPDKRGIDVALIYKKNLVNIIDYKYHPLFIYDKKSNNRIFTRDQLLAKCEINSDTIFLMVNHWPSRYGGQERSAPLRNEAAKLNRHIIDSILLINENAKIITMGDFNDNPTDESIVNFLVTKPNKADINSKDLFNPLANTFKENKGTLYYRGNWNLFDQMIISEALLNTKNGFKWENTLIFNKPYLIEQEGKYKNYLKRTFGGKKYLNGYSDHLPVYTILSN